MAQNLKVEISESPIVVPEGVSKPWNVKIEWLEQDAEGDYIDPVPVRTWSVDVPSELVANTIRLAFQELSDADYESVMSQGFER